MRSIKFYEEVQGKSPKQTKKPTAVSLNPKETGLMNSFPPVSTQIQDELLVQLIAWKDLLRACRIQGKDLISGVNPQMLREGENSQH